jgi:hypothetical protein
MTELAHFLLDYFGFEVYLSAFAAVMAILYMIDFAGRKRKNPHTNK